MKVLRSFTIFFLLVVVLASQPAMAQVSFGVSLSQEDITPNPPFSPTIHFVRPNGERVGSWDQTTGASVAAPVGDVWEFQPNPVGLNPNDITRVAVSLDWANWYEGQRGPTGWAVQFDSRQVPVRGYKYAPVMLVEGMIGTKKFRFIFTFTWRTKESVFGLLKIMAWEPPVDYERMSRHEAFLYYQGIVQAWATPANQQLADQYRQQRLLLEQRQQPILTPVIPGRPGFQLGAQTASLVAGVSEPVQIRFRQLPVPDGGEIHLLRSEAKQVKLLVQPGAGVPETTVKILSANGQVRYDATRPGARQFSLENLGIGRYTFQVEAGGILKQIKVNIK